MTSCEAPLIRIPSGSTPGVPVTRLQISSPSRVIYRTPFIVTSACQPETITFEPSRKVTVPVGRAVPVAPFTEAVRVSGAPLATVLDDAVSAVVVLTMSELTLM